MTLADPTHLLFLQYVEAVVSSYMRAIRLEEGPQFKSWEAKGFRIIKECIQKLAESLVFDVVQQGTQKVTRQDAERWLQTNPTFLRMSEFVFSHLYQYRGNKVVAAQPDQEPVAMRKSYECRMLPMCEGSCNFVINFSSNLSATSLSSSQACNTCPTTLRSRTYLKCCSSTRTFRSNIN